MSPNVANSLVHDLVEMAKAMEQLPQVQAEAAQLRAERDECLEGIAGREATILRLKAEIESLHADKRALEVARDEAQFHALEANDRTQRALEFIKATFGNAGALIQALEPPKPEPTPAEVPVQAMPEAAPEVSEPKAIDNPLYGDPQHFGHVHEPHPADVVQPEPGPAIGEGVSVQAGEPASATQQGDNATTSPVSPTPDASSISDKPYSGRRYSDVVKGINAHNSGRRWDDPDAKVIPTKAQWHEGGGTEDNWWA